LSAPVSASPTAVLARYTVEASLDRVPAPVVQKVKELILDHLGCALGGSRTPLAQAAAEVARDGAPNGGAMIGAAASRGATIVGTPIKAAVGPAAFATATAANALDYDDTGPTGHPGATIIPAALALAETRRARGDAFLLAVLVGYEVWAHIAGAIQPGWERRVMVYGNGVTQTFGAAAAAARLLALDVERTRCALGLAGAFAPLPHDGKIGWDEARVSWIKDNVAWPAEGGLRAALLAERGVVATREILDGERGLWIMAGSDRCDFDRMTRGIGEEFDVLRISLKPYPCCRWLHSTVDALRQVIAEQRVEPHEIRRVTVRSMAPLVEWFQIRRPATMVDAEFSVPHAVAMTLLGRPRRDWWLETNRTDPGVLALMDRVAVELDPAAQAEYATHRDSARIPAAVAVETARGAFHRSRQVCHGGPDDPMTWREIEEKFREQAEPVIGERRAAAVLGMVTELEALRSLDELNASLATA
jgi:2-methylcitrate dehydratase PrpD